jgi:hypothetical protein
VFLNQPLFTVHSLCYASPQFFHILFIRFHPNFITYWAIVGFTEAIDYFKSTRSENGSWRKRNLELPEEPTSSTFLIQHAARRLGNDDEDVRLRTMVMP